MHTPEQQRLIDRYNLVFVAAFSLLWCSPLLHYWMIVAPQHLGTRGGAYFLISWLSLLLIWVPQRYYRLWPFERSGRLYERLGIRTFHHYITRGAWVNRRIRRRDPTFRYIRVRGDLNQLAELTRTAEQSHLVFLFMGLPATLHAAQIGAHGWVSYLIAANILTNLYPILLQRYLRGRLDRLPLTPQGESAARASRTAGSNCAQMNEHTTP